MIVKNIFRMCLNLLTNSNLFTSLRKKIVLIEDMPTFVAYHPEDFWDTIKEYSKFGKFPIVMIMSDSSQGYRVPHQYLNIAFNPIANTLLSK